MTNSQFLSLIITILLASGANLFALGRWQSRQQDILRRLDQIEQRIVDLMVEVRDLGRRLDRIEKERT